MRKYKNLLLIIIALGILPLLNAQADDDEFFTGSGRGAYIPPDVCVHVEINLSSSTDETELSATRGISLPANKFSADKYIIDRDSYDELSDIERALLIGTSTQSKEDFESVIENLDLVPQISRLVNGSWYLSSGHLPYKTFLEDQNDTICDDTDCETGLLETSARIFGIPRREGATPFVLRVDAQDNDCFGIRGTKAYTLNVEERDGDVDGEGRELITDVVTNDNVSSFLFIANHKGEIYAKSARVSYGRLPAGLSLRTKTPSCSKARYESNPTNCTRGGVQIVGKTNVLGKKYFNVLFKLTDGTEEERTYVIIVSKPEIEPSGDE